MLLNVHQPHVLPCEHESYYKIRICELMMIPSWSRSEFCLMRQETNAWQVCRSMAALQ